MIKNSFLIIFFMASSFAQDCTGLKENEEQRLDVPGGPLANAQVQDQDGLGTCYANAASVALQSALPGNPDVSYLQLAFASGQKNALSQKAKNSAYFDDSDESLVVGGQVCETFNEAKSSAMGGVCLRGDVALEKSLFNPETNAFKDTFSIQKQLIYGISKSYDSMKSKFSINKLDSAQEIAKKTMEHNQYKRAFENLIFNNKDKFTKKECNKAGLSNPLEVFNMMMLKQFSYFQNKYGDRPVSETIDGKKNPDWDMYNFYQKHGPVKVSKDGEMLVEISTDIKNTLEKDYLEGDRASSSPSKSAVTAFRNAFQNDSKYNRDVVNKLMNEMGPAAKSMLERDIPQNFSSELMAKCMKKKALLYFESDNGFIKDYSNDACLKNYLPQGKSFQSLAEILDRANLNNLDALNTFMHQLPSMSYEQAMRSIVAPDCSDAKKIKIPESLQCENRELDYLALLHKRVEQMTKLSSREISRRIDEEKKKLESDIKSAYEKGIAEVEEEFKNLPLDATKELEKKNKRINLGNKKTKELGNAALVAKARVLKTLAGDKEQGFWNEHLSTSKNKFNSDTINLLKNQKRAVPISLCTSVFSSPSISEAARNGTCGQGSGDGKYQEVGGRHAVAIVGFRCQKGKLNYLIQNSWGDWNDIKDVKNADGSQHFEHEFGKAWMNEDELISNTFNYQKISGE